MAEPQFFGEKNKRQLQNCNRRDLQVVVSNIASLIAKVFSVNLVTAVLQLATNIWVYRYIGPNELGLFASSVIAIDLATVIANLGVNQFIIRFPNSYGAFGTVFRVVVGQAVAFTFLASACLFYLDIAGKTDTISPLVFILILVSRVLNLFGTLFFSPLEGELKYNPIIKSRLIARTTSIVAVFILIPFFAGSLVLGLREALYALIYFLFSFFYAQDRICCEYSSMKLKAIFHFVAPLYVLNIFERANPRIDLFFVRTTLGNEALGIYFGLRQIFEGFFGFVATVVQSVVFSVYNNMRFDQVFFDRTMMGSWVLSGASIVFWATSFLVGSDLTKLILGAEYMVAGSIWMAFTSYFLALLVFENTKAILMSIGRHRLLVLPRVVQALSLVLGFIVCQERMSMVLSATILFGCAILLCLLSLKSLYNVRHSRGI